MPREASCFALRVSGGIQGYPRSKFVIHGQACSNLRYFYTFYQKKIEEFSRKNEAVKSVLHIS